MFSRYESRLMHARAAQTSTNAPSQLSTNCNCNCLGGGRTADVLLALLALQKAEGRSWQKPEAPLIVLVVGGWWLLIALIVHCCCLLPGAALLFISWGAVSSLPIGSLHCCPKECLSQSISWPSSPWHMPSTIHAPS